MELDCREEYIMIDLFKPYRIGSLELRNRFMRSATWDATADETGTVTEESLAIYRRLGRGGIGLIVTGYAFVSLQGQSARGQYGAYSDDLIGGLSQLAKVVHEGGGKICLQIVHGGINSNFLASKGATLLAVSERLGDGRLHREMTDEDVQNTINDFSSAAWRAVEAGFDAVQLHGAHGFLMSQFLSPLFNTRTDRWGGTAVNRRRFHLELIRQIRRRIGSEFPLLIKFGVKDDQEGGLSLDEGVETAKQMAKAGIDAIEVSAGIGGSSLGRNSGEGESTPFRERASAIKHALAISVALVGGVRSLETAQDIIDKGDADLISMSRPFIREPDLINRWQHDNKVALCISCNKCHAVIRSGKALECGEELSLKQD
jgi:2,4-dienoyl-CoA reductase-like NADH-dependent reductase (Old Yellow Enzyme family)